MGKSYFGTHTHTFFSNVGSGGLDCMNRLTDVVARAKELGMTGVAITNHDNLSEVVDINRLQKKLKKDNDDFVLAIGNEIYLIDGYKNDAEGRMLRQRYYHFILIAKDRIGFNALVELSSRAWYRSEMRYGRRRVPTLYSDVEEVMKWAKGHLVATTACVGGFLGQSLIADDVPAAQRFVDWCVEQFGKEDFYIELQPSVSKEQEKFNKMAYKLFRPERKFIIATDAHYLSKEEFPVFEAFLRSQQENRDVQEFYGYARMMGAEEIHEILDYFSPEFIRECLDNTLHIQSQIEFYDLSQKFHIPKVKLPEIKPKYDYEWERGKRPNIDRLLYSDDIQSQYCVITCLDKLKERGLWNDIYLDRLEEEMDVFNFQSDELNDNFYAYFNSIAHFIDVAWSVNCAVGPSRGSASGSLICYLMDVVQGDPIQNGYYSWRFANKVRASVLDCDTDFAPSKRPALFEAIRKERGELGLVQVATFRKLTLKAAIGNAGRGYRSKDFPEGLPPDITTYLSSLIEVKRGFVATLEQTKHGDEHMGFTTNAKFLKEVEQYPGLLQIIERFEGVIVGSSTHAAAVILFDEEDKLQHHCSLMRAPNGDLCTALDLHTVEETGCIKFDFLVLSTLDIMSSCFELLQRDKIIDPSLSLKECYRKYIDPNKIDDSDQRIWDILHDNSVLSVFQFDQASGRKGVLATNPRSIDEMTAVNALIRLMTPEGGEDQIERFVRIKNNPQSFEEEMIRNGLDAAQRQILHEELDKYNGCCVMQENFMVLTQKLIGYSLADADLLRKLVAKKNMAAITAEEEKFNKFAKERGFSQETTRYLWGLIIAPSLGYGFSKNHSQPYSIVGVQCILLGGILFPPIYWQTACLLQRSGALDDKTTDHNKVARAVATLAAQGVDIRPVNVNKSQGNFALDKEKNAIYFGLNTVKGIKAKAVESIIENRPYTSIEDFMTRTKADITSVVTLIKADAFGDFCSREAAIEAVANLRADIKPKLNGQNLAMLSRKGFWPQDTEELVLSQRYFNFTEYLKKYSKSKGADKETYLLDGRACGFLDEMGIPHDGESVLKASWKNIYDIMMIPIKQYLKDNQEEMLEKVNSAAKAEWLEKYFEHGDPAYGEIEAMGLTFLPHPMRKTQNISDFDDLPQVPTINNIFVTKTGRTIPLYSLTMIAGIVIAKDKLHTTITILTASGPVNVKFRKEQFAHYDAQISVMENGKRKVVEKSWFRRGTSLIIHGMRQDDTFLAKTYKNSPMSHTAYKITSINENGKLEVQKERKKGVANESEDEE